MPPPATPPPPPPPAAANAIPDAGFTFAHGATIADPAEAGPVAFDGSGSRDSDGTIAKWEWRIGGGAYVDRGPTWTPTLAPGHWLVWLKVTDDRGAFDAIAKEIFVRGDAGERDAWGRPLSTLTFSFTITGASGTTTPALTAAWH